MERSTTPPFHLVPWAEKLGNNRNIAARREALQEKDTEKEIRLGEDLRKQVVEFADKSTARADKERSRWKEALDRDTQLRIPHAKFRLLLKTEKEEKKLEKEWQEDKEKADASGKQTDTSISIAARRSNDSGERTHADLGDQHPGWIRPGPKTRVIRIRYAHQLWEQHAHLWDKANSFWEEIKIRITKAESMQRSSWLPQQIASDIHHRSEFAHECQGSKDDKFKQEEVYKKYTYFPEECQML